MREKFKEQLHELNMMLIKMGALCEEAISLSVKALVARDVELAKKVQPVDSEIDHMERDIESMCLKLILQQQPVARDLRQISAALKMITDMERIGDQAEDIAELVVYLQSSSPVNFNDIEEMAKAVTKMVTASIDAYVKQDLEIAEEVIEYDDVVDDYFNKVKKSLIDSIGDGVEDPESALDLLMVAKYFERIGDHAENIAEWVKFAITGIHE